MMLGQIRVEFVFGLVIFSVIVVFIVTQTNTVFSSLLADSNSDVLKAKAISIINVLVEDPGDPYNWNSAPQSAQRIGLANAIAANSYQPYNLSSAKITALNTNCTNTGVYGNLLYGFEMKAYRLQVFNSTQRLLFCGFDSLEPSAVSEVRYVYIQGDYGKVTLELW
jgi:hypothetical protein